MEYDAPDGNDPAGQTAAKGTDLNQLGRHAAVKGTASEGGESGGSTVEMAPVLRTVVIRAVSEHC